MQQHILEPRPLYGIGTVARLTGIKPDTLRVWERRYGLGASHKSDTGRRQYTQSDLEHLQLVAALIDSGVRIGEIASSGRKTLEMLLRGHGKDELTVAVARPRVIFVGEQLCAWLDEHQGCLANVDAKLARMGLAECEPARLGNVEPVDMLVIECGTVASAQLQQVQALAAGFGADRVLLAYHACSQKWQEELEQRGFSASAFPPDPAYLAYELTRTVAESVATVGSANLGELVTSKPRQFSARELDVASTLKFALDCECPRHITDLIGALATFEEYSASCSVDSWHDAAVHSCIYAYTGQARWLMEKALQAVLEEHSAQYQEGLQQHRGGRLNDAA